MPSSNPTILSLDIGSTGVRAASYDAGSGERISAIERVEYEGAFSPGKRQVKTVQDAIVRCLGRVKGLDRVSLVSHGSMAPSLVVYGKSVSEIIAHDDRRSESEARQLLAQMSAKTRKQVGNLPIPGGISCTSLKWQLDRMTGEQKKQIRWVGHLSTWFNYVLTGNAAMDYSHASFTGMYDSKEKTWVQPMLKAVGVKPEWLPEVGDATTIIGHVRKLASKIFGLPIGAAVLPGVIDTSATILNTPMKPGTLIHSMGSTDVLALITDRMVIQDDCLTRHIGTERMGVGQYLAVVTLAAGGTLLEWGREMFFADLSEKKYYAVVKSLMDRLVKGEAESKGIHFQPHIVGSRMVVEQPTAGFSGLSLNHTREDLLVAILKAYRDQMKSAYETLSGVKRINQRVFMTGGASSVAPLLHADWPKRHEYVKLPEGNVDGLALIGIKALSSD